MKYSITIDNVTASEWGLNVNQSYMFAWLYSLSSWADSISYSGSIFYFASRNKAIDELPLLTDKPDTVYRYYRALESMGLIELIKVENKDYIKLTEKGKSWNNIPNKEAKVEGKQPRKKIRGSENRPTQLGNLSDSTRKFIRNTSEKNPTYNNTIDNTTSDKITNDKKAEPFFVCLFDQSFEIFSKGGLSGVFFQIIKKSYGFTDHQVQTAYEWWKKYHAPNAADFLTEKHLRNSFNKFCSNNVKALLAEVGESEESSTDYINSILEGAAELERRRYGS